MGRPKKETDIQLNFEDNRRESMLTNDKIVDTDALESMETEMDRVRVALEKAKLELEEKKKEIENLPLRQEKAALDKNVAVVSKDAGLSQKIAEQKVRDNTMVTGKFSNLRAPGQSIKLPYHKYADDPVKWYPFDHGKVYTIPKGFADQLNGGDDLNPCYYSPQFIKNDNIITNPDEPGTGIHGVDTSNKKYMFSPVSF